MPPLKAINKSDKLKKAIINSEDETNLVLRELHKEQGTGTLLDLPIQVSKVVPGSKKVIPYDKIEDSTASLREKITGADLAAGEYLATKNKLLEKIFSHTDMLPKGKAITEAGEVIDTFVPVRQHRLSAPTDKVKDIAVPILAVSGISAIMNDSKGKKKEEGAVEKEIIQVKTAQDSLSDYLSKVASLRVKAEKASGLLRTASEKIQEKEAQILSLEEKVASLENIIIAKEKSNKATKLANNMLKKGILKQADYNDKVDYIMSLTDEGYEVLASTVDSLPTKSLVSGQDTLSKVSYVIGDGDSAGDPATFEDTLISMAKRPR